jgi:hypothetical protein
MTNELRAAILMLLDDRYRVDRSTAVYDTYIADELKASLADVRRHMDILETQGWTQTANSREERRAWISPRGMLVVEEIRAKAATESLERSDGLEDASLEIRLFISHSSRDKRLADALVDLLHGAINIPTRQIRCTSVEGHGLQGGAETNKQLRQEITRAKVFIALISPISIESAYVLFEMGARWGSNQRLIPLLASGADASHLRGPLAGINALRCTSEEGLHQLVQEVAWALGATLEPVASFLDKLRAVQASGVAATPIYQPDERGATTPKITLTLEHELLIGIFAQATWRFARAEKIGDMAKLTPVRTQHLLEQLADWGFVDISGGQLGPVYSLSKAGRAHAVQQGYC